MFPYIEQPALTLWGTRFYAFGLMVALAVVVGSWLVLRRAERQGLARAETTNLLLWTLGVGFLVSHLDHLAFARPDIFLRPSSLWEQPALWLNLWNGMSAFGGILGGALGAALYLWRHRWDSRERWIFMEAVAWSFPFAWAIARFGCYLAHDHPGILTNSWLAVPYPDGGRFDLGLFDCFLALAICAAFLWLDGRPKPRAFYFLTFLFTYAPARMLLDVLRVEERFLGLTAGQYGALVMSIVAVVTLGCMRGHRAVAEERTGEWPWAADRMRQRKAAVN